MSTCNNYGYDLVRYSMDKLAAAVRLALGAFANFGWPAPRQQAQRLPQRRTIGKEHRGYARRSRQRLVQRKGYKRWHFSTKNIWRSSYGVKIEI